jgi:TP901 family phage tail tape measure protein
MSLVNRYNLAIVIQEVRRGNAIKQLQGDVRGARGEIYSYNHTAGRGATVTNRFNDRVKKLGRMVRQMLIPAFLVATGAISKFAVDSIREVAQFEKKLQEVFTLIPDASETFRGELEADIRYLNQQYGKLSDETLPALYQAISAGVPKENAVEAVGVATEAALAGVAELDDTMKTGMAIVNAYAGEVYELEDAYDILFQLIRFGVVTMDDLNGSLSNVISIAAESQTPFEDIAAALVVMTRQGDSASEATELLGLLLQQLGTDGTAAFKVFSEAAGIGYRDFIAQGNGLVDALIIMQNHADETGQSLSAMISGDSPFYRDTQAARATLELTGAHLEEVVAQLVNMENASGAMGEAFVTATDNVQFKFDKLKSNFAEMKIAFGQDIMDSIIGERVLDATSDIAESASGFWDQTARNQLEALIASETTAAGMVRNLEKINEAYSSNAIINQLDTGISATKLTKLQDEFAEGFEAQAAALAGVSSSYDEWIQLMEIGGAVFHENMFGPPDHFIKGTLVRANEEFFELHQNVAQLAQVQAQARQQAELYISSLTRMHEAAKAPDPTDVGKQTKLPSTGLGGQFIPDQPTTTDVFGAFDDPEKLKELTNNLNAVGETIIWLDIQTNQLSDSVLEYMASITEHGGALIDNYNLLNENAGQWIQTQIDNGTEMTAIMEELTGDLTGEQRDAMWEILNTVEEGGEQWMSAWSAIQGDLTQTQRFELIAQMADFQSTHGAMQGIWAGDKEAALAAAEGIFTALEEIQNAYQELSTSIAEEALAARFTAESEEYARAMITYKTATGEITPEEAALLGAQLDTATQLDTILAEMWTAYLTDGKLTKIEADNIALAQELIATNTETMTTPALKNMIDTALDEVGGYPAVGQILVQLQDDEHLGGVQAAANAIVDDGPYDPEFGMDADAFYKDMPTLLEEINSLLGPWTIELKYKVINSPPGPPGGSSPPDETGHHGLDNFIVPSGYPNDSFTLGLTSGELVNVDTAAQQRGGSKRSGRGYNDNRRFNVVINNHTRAASQLARAQLDALSQSRASAFAGG